MSPSETGQLQSGYTENQLPPHIEIMNRAEKNWAYFQKTKYFKNQSSQKISPFRPFLIWFDLTLKLQILQSLRRLFIILVGLTMTWFSEKCLFPNLCPTWSKILDGIYSGTLDNIVVSNWNITIFVHVDS